MVAVASPNWLILVGLMCMLFSLIFLGDAIGADGARWSSGKARGAGLHGYQRVALTMALSLFGIGLVLAMLGQLLIVSMSTALAVGMVGLAFALLIFALVADLVGAKLDAAALTRAAVVQREMPTTVETRDNDAPRIAERLRIAL